MNVARKKHRKRPEKKRSKLDLCVSSPVEACPLAPTVTDVQASPTALLSTAEDVGREGQLEPHDEHLLNRARTQWQFGDWGSLAELSIEQIQHHPERARLALLVAAGYQQLGHQGDTRHFARMAREWGCERSLIGRVLISGVYNTLGRARALVGHSTRAQQHIQTALAVGAPSQALALLTIARLQHNLMLKVFPSR